MEDKYTPIYKKWWFWMIVAVALCLIFFNQYINTGNEKATTSVQPTASTSVQPTASTSVQPTASTSLAKGTLHPNATDIIKLTEDTLYDEEDFRIIMPKNSTFTKDGINNYWYVPGKKNLVMIAIYATGYPLIIDAYIASEETLQKNMDMIEAGSNNTIKMYKGYKKVTIGGKKALLLTGEYYSDKTKLDMYLVEGSEGFCVVIGKYLYNDEDSTIKDMNQTAEKILSTLIIK